MINEKIILTKTWTVSK